MKKYVSFILILILLIGSFYYADKVSNFIINKSPLMKTLKSNKDKYEIKSVDAIVSDEYIIPGIEGKKVSEIESYYNMKKYNTFVSDNSIAINIIGILLININNCVLLVLVSIKANNNHTTIDIIYLILFFILFINGNNR